MADSGAELVETLESLADGEEIIDMSISGHSGHGTNGNLPHIAIGGDGMIVIVGGGAVVVSHGNAPTDPSTDITQQLIDHTGPRTNIELDGCNTDVLAEQLDKAIGGDSTIQGHPWPVFDLPFNDAFPCWPPRYY